MTSHTYGYSSKEYSKFKEFAWKMLISFGLTYMFFYNGRQNINLVLTQMAEGLGSTTAAMGVVSSTLFWCYAFGQLINGRLGAYFGYKRFMMFGVAQVVTYLTILGCMELNPDWGWRAAFRYPMISMVLMLIAFAFFFKTKPEDIGLKPFEEIDQETAQRDAALMLLLVGISGMVTGVIWAVAGDMGGRAFSSSIVGILDWAVYMGAAIQASVFGWVKDAFGCPAVFISIGVLYIVMLALTLLARKMKMTKV